MNKNRHRTTHGYVAVKPDLNPMWWTFRKTKLGVKEAVHSNYPLRCVGIEEWWKIRELEGYKVCAASRTIIDEIDL